MKLAKIGLLLVFLGILIIVISTIIIAFTSISSSGGEGETGVAGCIVILFIPICFGTGSPGLVSILLTASLVITFLILLLVFIQPIIYRRVHQP